jgi:hypothetical protein
MKVRILPTVKQLANILSRLSSAFSMKFGVDIYYSLMSVEISAGRNAEQFGNRQTNSKIPHSK